MSGQLPGNTQVVDVSNVTNVHDGDVFNATNVKDGEVGSVTKVLAIYYTPPSSRIAYTKTLIVLEAASTEISSISL